MTGVTEVVVIQPHSFENGWFTFKENKSIQ